MFDLAHQPKLLPSKVTHSAGILCMPQVHTYMLAQPRPHKARHNADMPCMPKVDLLVVITYTVMPAGWHTSRGYPHQTQGLTGNINNIKNGPWDAQPMHSIATMVATIAAVQLLYLL